MPFQSQAQRAWMYANKPEMAKQWQQDTPNKSLPAYVRPEGQRREAAVKNLLNQGGNNGSTTTTR